MGFGVILLSTKTMSQKLIERRKKPPVNEGDVAHF